MKLLFRCLIVFKIRSQNFKSTIYLPIYVSIYLYIYIYLSIYIPICSSHLFIYISIDLSFYLPIQLFIYLSIYISIYLSIYLYIYPIHLFIIYLSIHVFNFQSVDFTHLSIYYKAYSYLYIYLSIYLSRGVSGLEMDVVWRRERGRISAATGDRVHLEPSLNGGMDLVFRLGKKASNNKEAYTSTLALSISLLVRIMLLSPI